MHEQILPFITAAAKSRLAVGIGAAGIHLSKKGRWRWLVVLALAGIAAAFLNEFLVMVPRFYSEYLFL